MGPLAVITIGIDPYKASLTAVAVGPPACRWAAAGYWSMPAPSANGDAACRRQLARELLGDLRRVDARLADNKAQLRDALAATGSTLTQVHGLGVVVAARLLGHVGDIGRFPSRDHFASYTATAPLDASSGNQQRHRLNPGGNRRLNAALHLIAVCQARDPGPGRRYYLRKLTQGKTPAEARRALKRRLANVIYRRLLADQRRYQAAAAWTTTEPL
jgi:transposase